VVFLIEQNWPEAPTAVVSLLCWDDAYLPSIRAGFGDNGEGILKRSLLPVRGPGNAVVWASPLVTCAWLAPPDACLSNKSICEVAGASLLLESLTPKQRAALDHLYMLL